jgi:hypothetical protein
MKVHKHIWARAMTETGRKVQVCKRIDIGCRAVKDTWTRKGRLITRERIAWLEMENFKNESRIDGVSG